MAKASFALPFSRVSGTVRSGSSPSVLSVRGSSGAAAAVALPATAAAPSPSQLHVRSVVAQISAAWGSLSDSQRAGWRSIAPRIQLRNRMRQRYHPSGFNAFRWVNQLAVLGGKPIIPDPPSSLAVPNIPQPLVVSLTSFAGDLYVDLAISPGATFAALRFTRAIPPGNRALRESDYLMIGPANIATLQPVPPPVSVVLPMTYFSLAPGDEVASWSIPLSAEYIPGIPVVSRHVVA